jgi:hypothetical protein
MEEKTDFKTIKEKTFQIMRETFDFISGLILGILLYHVSV